VTVVGILVTAPNGGESWPIGSSRNVTWDSFGVAAVRIELSRNGGLVWEDVAASVDAPPGSHSWTVTEPGSADCLVRVSDASDATLADESDGTFVVTLATWYVDADVALSGDGRSWDEALKGLEEALAVAVDGDDIYVAQGTYKPTATTDRTISFVMVDGVYIHGGYAGFGEADPDARDVAAYTTTLSGDIGTPADSSDNSYHVVIGASNATLDGFTVTGGNANGGVDPYKNGAGVYGDGLANCWILECTVSANAASSSGGGIYAINSVMDLSGCVLTGNSAAYGAALSASAGCTLTADGCVFAGNNAGSQGGGLKSFGASLTLRNCLFSANTAGSQGGGAFVDVATPSFINCVFMGNSSSTDAGALHVTGGQTGLTNCIFRNNSAPTGAEIDNNNSSILTIAYTNVQGGWDGAGVDNHASATLANGGGNIDADPLFVDAADHDGPDGIWMTTDDGLVLSSGSPCIDAADTTQAPAADIIVTWAPMSSRGRRWRPSATSRARASTRAGLRRTILAVPHRFPLTAGM
jgi:hypothetical protein